MLNINILYHINTNYGDGDWGLGIGPNPQSPIPNPQSPLGPIPIFLVIFSYFKNIIYIKFLINKKCK